MSPPALTTLARRALQEAALEPGARLVVAVSGGADSMALLHVLAHLRHECKLHIVAHGVDHGLRPAAAEELRHAAELAQQLDVPFSVSSLQLAAGGNLQARAREARYAALDAVRLTTGASHVVTAHHARDRAETVLLRLLRGAPLQGLGVLPVLAPHRLRPLVHAPKQAIEQHVRRFRLRVAHDPSNDDPRFLRVRLRHELLPLLRELSPDIEANLCRLAEQATQLPNETEEFRTSDGTPLKRRTREALAKLNAAPSARARIWLPGGLAAGWNTSHTFVQVDDPAETALPRPPGPGVAAAPVSPDGAAVRSRSPRKSRTLSST